MRAMARRSELRDGIRKGEIVMHYQPVVEAPDGRPSSGSSGLARSGHPTRGLVSPAGCRPLAEGNEPTIWELTLDVAELALSDIARTWDLEWPLVVAISRLRRQTCTATSWHWSSSDRMRAQPLPAAAASWSS